MDIGLEIRETSYGGRGVFAKKHFEPGDLVHEETPLITLGNLTSKELKASRGKSGIFRNNLQYLKTVMDCDDEVRQKLKNCSFPSKDIACKSYLWKHVEDASKFAANDFYPDCSPDNLSAICTLFSSNQYHGEGEGSVIYEYGSMFNHCCRSNITYRYLESSNTGQWIAIRPIVVGDEVCVRYVAPFYPTFWRQEQLFHRYFFKCKCEYCEREDLSRMLPCTQCAKRERGVLELEENEPKQTGYFISSKWKMADCWKCDNCGFETLVSGVPIKIESQILIEVQLMMKRWETASRESLEALLKLATKSLGPKHFATVFAQKVLLEYGMQENKIEASVLSKEVEKIIDWMEICEPGFAGFHLRGFLAKVAQFCLLRKSELDLCHKIIKCVKPWVFLLEAGGSTTDSDSWYEYEALLSKIQDENDV